MSGFVFVCCLQWFLIFLKNRKVTTDLFETHLSTNVYIHVHFHGRKRATYSYGCKTNHPILLQCFVICRLAYLYFPLFLKEIQSVVRFKRTTNPGYLRLAPGSIQLYSLACTYWLKKQILVVKFLFFVKFLSTCTSRRYVQV